MRTDFTVAQDFVLLSDVKLAEKDVREVVRLVGNAPLQPGGHAGAKRFLMTGLAKLIRADAWIWGLLCARDPLAPQAYVSIMRAGFTDATFTKFLEACEHPDMIELASRFFAELKAKDSHLTRSRFQIADAKRIEASDAIEVWKAANIGPTLLSSKPLGPTSTSMVGIYRRHGRTEFSASEIRIAHIVLSEVAWLHEQGWPEDRGVSVPTLTRRERLTLNLLTAGQSHKELASQMGLSIHTTRDYVKAVYRHFRVNSQTQLMSRFYRGDGRDQSDAAVVLDGGGKRTRR